MNHHQRLPIEIARAAAKLLHEHEKLIKTLPIDGIDGRPIKRAKINRVASLLADSKATQSTC